MTLDHIARPLAAPAKFPIGYRAPSVLPWSWAERLLNAAPLYWFAAVTDAGVPYVRPLWGAWHGTELWFRTGSKLTRFFAAQPMVSVHLSDADDIVILDGAISGPEQTPEPVIAAYLAKYANSPVPDPAFVFRPARAFGWNCDNSGYDDGTRLRGTATRWDFQQDPLPDTR